MHLCTAGILPTQVWSVGLVEQRAFRCGAWWQCQPTVLGDPRVFGAMWIRARRGASLVVIEERRRLCNNEGGKLGRGRGETRVRERRAMTQRRETRKTNDGAARSNQSLLREFTVTPFWSKKRTISGCPLCDRCGPQYSLNEVQPLWNGESRLHSRAVLEQQTYDTQMSHVSVQTSIASGHPCRVLSQLRHAVIIPRNLQLSLLRRHKQRGSEFSFRERGI